MNKKEQARIKALLGVLFPDKMESVPAEEKQWADHLLANKENKLSLVSKHYVKVSKQWSEEKKYELFKIFWNAHMDKGYLSEKESYSLLLWAKEWKLGKRLMACFRPGRT